MNIKQLAQIAAAVLLSTLNPQPSTCFAQGSLAPPGAPAPTFKTLDQVKPGTPITNIPFTITNSGCFFLTSSFSNSGTAIIINGDDVSLDLGGFTLTGEGVAGHTGVQVGANISSGQRRVRIRHGT